MLVYSQRKNYNNFLIDYAILGNIKIKIKQKKYNNLLFNPGKIFLLEETC